ncbi:MAG: hypothetical protein HZB37_08955, partial [Planctomycetes bacterium]|nr:hypothetical protein [Planctomycetota bacterium]
QVDVILVESQCKVHTVAAIKIPSRVTQAHRNADEEQKAYLAREVHSVIKRQSTGILKETNIRKAMPHIYLKSLKPQISQITQIFGSVEKERHGIMTAFDYKGLQLQID